MSDRPSDRPPPTERDARDRDNDGLPDTLRQRLEALVPEIVKRTFNAGMGAVFSTEEGLRKLAKDNLPAAAGYIASSADSAKDKVLEVMARETREFLQTMNFTEEIAKILTTLSFEIKTEIRFIPNSERYGGIEPDVKAGVRLKLQDRDDRGGSGGGRAGERTERGERGDRAERTERGDRPEPRSDDDGARDRPSRLRFWRRGEGGERDDGPDVDDPLDPEE